MTRLFLRVISKSKEAYALKVVTLGTAFACCLLLLLFASREFTYDHFHGHYQSLFRVIQRNNDEAYSGNRLSNRISKKAYEKLHAQSSDLLIVSRMKWLTQCNLLVGNETVRNTTFHAADTSITSIFSFEPVDGSLRDFGRIANGALLSSSLSASYFGTTESAGKKFKVFTFSDTIEYTIAAVYKDFPKNSHEQYKAVLPFDAVSISKLNFNPSEFGIYGRQRLSDIATMENTLQDSEETLSYQLQPIHKIYFGPRVLGEEARHGDEYSIFILISLCVLLLILATSSFVNLTTLTLPNRAKELAIKKLAGSHEWHVMASFARESFALVGLSLVLAALMVAFASRWLGSELAISVSDLIESETIAVTSAVLVPLVLLVGVSPLFITWKFARATPNRLLSTDTITFPKFKRTISVVQLGISIFLMIASLVVGRQISYSLIKEPGRNHDQVVYVSYPSYLTPSRLNELRKEWKKSHPNILDITATSQIPDRINSRDVATGYYFMTVDPGFKDFFNIEMKAGKWFGANHTDSSFVINESTGRRPALNHHAIGVFGNLTSQFNQPSKPLMLKVSDKPHYNILCIRVLEVDIRRTIAYLSNHFEEGGLKAHVNFLNKSFEEWLVYQDRLNTLSGILTIVSGLLACLAIYGLATCIVRDKLKQIAIHKLWGAEFRHLTHMLIQEFAGQLFIAVAIFLPLTYLVLREILRTFVYATPFSWIDPVIPLIYCVVVIAALCSVKTLSLNQRDLSAKLKG